MVGDADGATKLGLGRQSGLFGAGAHPRIQFLSVFILQNGVCGDFWALGSLELTTQANGIISNS